MDLEVAPRTEGVGLGVGATENVEEGPAIRLGTGPEVIEFVGQFVSVGDAVGVVGDLVGETVGDAVGVAEGRTVKFNKKGSNTSSLPLLL